MGLLICEAADGWGHQTDFQNSVGTTVIEIQMKHFQSPTEIARCRFKTVKRKKNAQKDLSACGTPGHVEGQAFSKFINKLNIDNKKHTK